MSRASWALASLLVVAGSMPLRAQFLTEQQFLDDTLAGHPAIAAAEAEVAAASGVRRQAGIVDNPEIAWVREDPDIAPRQDTVVLNWRLPFDGRRHRMDAADAAIDASSSELEATRLRIRLEMRSLFASWYIAARREAVLQANLDRTRRLSDRMQARAQDGESSGLEARRLELEVEVLGLEAAAARAEARATRSAAASWSALVTGDAEPTRPPLPTPPSSPDIGDRPDIRALSYLAVAAESRHQLQQRVLEPPAISVGWTEIADGVRSFDGPVFGFAWPLPLFDRNQGRREAASAEVSRARFELEVAQKKALEQLQAALASYSEFYAMVVRGAAGETDSDVVDTMLAVFEAGEASLTDVLDALRATVDVRMARIEALARALVAERELESALGRPLLSGGSS